MRCTEHMDNCDGVQVLEEEKFQKDLEQMCSNNLFQLLNPKKDTRDNVSRNLRNLQNPSSSIKSIPPKNRGSPRFIASEGFPILLHFTEFSLFCRYGKRDKPTKYTTEKSQRNREWRADE